MKTFLWMLTISLGILCYAAWLAGELVASYVRDFRQGFIPSVFAELVLHHTWLLLCPLPWILYAALLSRRRDLSAEAIFVFAGTIGLAITAIVCAVALGGMLSCIPFKL